jgi:hypothetical protein
MCNPGITHWETTKQVLHYLKGTCDYGLMLGGSKTGLEVYVDADWASQGHHHSISRYLILLN